MGIQRTVTASVAALAAAAALASASACDHDGDTTGVTTVVIDSMVISSEGVEPVEGRTYESDVPSVRPDSVLEALRRDGIDVERAWRPLHYACEDARGPRLTVQLAAPDAAMVEHDFSLGTGRLGCSPDLMRYLVSDGD